MWWVPALPPYSLAIWHGFNLPLLMSTLALFGGVLVYSQRAILFRLHERYPPPVGQLLFAAGLNRLLDGARWLTGWLENGALQRYLALLVLAALLAGLVGLWPTGLPATVHPGAGAQPAGPGVRAAAGSDGAADGALA